MYVLTPVIMPIKKRSSLDKLVKGIIIGGAIGSVVGVTLAPKSGKETRSDIKNKANTIMTKASKKKTELLTRKKKTKGPVGTVFSGVKTLIFGKKTK